MMTTQALFRFDGATFDQALDGERLTTHLERVKALMLDGKWHTLREIAELTNGSESGTSARLRDLRKTRFGAYTIERRRTANPAVWEYRAK